MDKIIEFRSFLVRYIIDGFKIKTLSNKIGTSIVFCNVLNNTKRVSESQNLVEDKARH
jgi:hypothetical protein